MNAVPATSGGESDTPKRATASSATATAVPILTAVPEESQRSRTGTPHGVSYLYMLAAFVVVTAGIRMAQEILQLLLLSVFLAVVGVPVYAWLVQQKVASWLALLFVISGLVLTTLVLFWIVMTSLADFTSRQQHYVEQLQERTRPLRQFMETLIPEAPVPETIPPADAVAAAEETGLPPEPASAGRAQDVTEGEDEPRDSQLAESAGWLQLRRVTVVPQSRRSWRELVSSQFDPGKVISMAANIAVSVSQLLSNTMLILLTVVFILLEASTFPKKLQAAFGDNPETQRRYQLIVARIRSYLVIKTAISLLTGLLIAAWLRLFGVPFAGLWGLLAFLLNYIPNIGSIIAAIPALLVAWLDLGLLVAAAACIGYVVVNMAVGNILEPRVMGRGMGLSALVVFCSMVFWGWALGPVGMLLSVPLTMAARVAFEGFDDTRWLGTLLGDAE